MTFERQRSLGPQIGKWSFLQGKELPAGALAKFVSGPSNRGLGNIQASVAGDRKVGCLISHPATKLDSRLNAMLSEEIVEHLRFERSEAAVGALPSRASACIPLAPIGNRVEVGM